MPDQEPDQGFTVVDRRGRSGEDDRVAEAAGAPPPGAPPPSRATSPPPPRTEPSGFPGGPPRADLASLCVMLYSDALVHLGQVPDPVTGQPHQDFEQARFMIDLLGMIQDKTAGNRTPEESAVLDEMLGNLRLGFVRLSRQP